MRRLRIADCGLRIPPVGNCRCDRALILWLAAAWAAATLIGCKPAATSPGSQSQQAALRNVDRGEALLKAAAGQLNDLPSLVDTELRPPVIILDSTKSSDNQDVRAVVTANPSGPVDVFNYVKVPANNARFLRLGVRSGDILKYYIIEDETVDEESRQAGFTRRVAMELIVAQVLADDALLVETGLNVEFPIPEKIEVWRYVDDRLVEINLQLRRYRDRRLPALGWEPSPDAKVLNQVVVWLNQWLRQSEPKTDWQLDPLLDTLNAEIRADKSLASHISKGALAGSSFEPHEGRLLQEAVWLRDISRWARGDSFDNVQRAAALFDWTVRNVQLDADENARAHRPWQVLLYGRGTAQQRAWVFALLGRQLGLDVVMLAVEPAVAQEGDPAAPAEKSPYWLSALLDDGQLYLFDTRLGLPVPGPGGEGVATFAQVQNDDSLLRHLDLEESPYPVTSESLQKVVAHVVADPFDLTRRAHQVESKLAGDERMVLAVKPSEVAARLKQLPQLEDVRLWALPFQTLVRQLSLGKSARLNEVLAFEPFAVRPLLWKARTRHFQGRREIVDETSAVDSDEVLDDHREAAQLYTNRSVRPTDRDIERATSDDKRRVDTTAKLNATYWLGLLSFDDGKYGVAAHWLGRPEIHAPASPWSSGARYNLARTREAQGNLEDAVTLLENNVSPQNRGDKLRAKWLKGRSPASGE